MKGWQIRPLGEVADLTLGKMLDKAKNRGEPRPYLRNLNVRWFDFDLSDLAEMKFESHEHERYSAKAGDVLICEGGYPGRAAVWSSPERIYFQKAIHRVRFYEPDRASWLVYFLWFLNETGQLRSRFTGAGIQHLTGEVLKRLPIPLPPLAEQRRIVAILDEAFAGLEAMRANAEKNLQNARELFQSHVNNIFEPSATNWLQAPLSDICEIKHGFAFDGKEFSENVRDGMPIVITPGNFTENGELLFNKKNTKRFSGRIPPDFCFDVGDLVVVMTDLSSKMKILGKPAFVEGANILHNQRIGRVVFKSDRVEKRWLYFYMKTDRFLSNIKGSATGTMVKHTAPKRILANVVRYPSSLSDQRAILSRIDALRGETQRLESIYCQKLAAIAELKQSILQKAFSGQIISSETIAA